MYTNNLYKGAGLRRELLSFLNMDHAIIVKNQMSAFKEFIVNNNALGYQFSWPVMCMDSTESVAEDFGYILHIFIPPTLHLFIVRVSVVSLLAHVSDVEIASSLPHLRVSCGGQWRPSWGAWHPEVGRVVEMQIGHQVEHQRWSGHLSILHLGGQVRYTFICFLVCYTYQGL